MAVLASGARPSNIKVASVLAGDFGVQPSLPEALAAGIRSARKNRVDIPGEDIRNFKRAEYPEHKDGEIKSST